MDLAATPWSRLSLHRTYRNTDMRRLVRYFSSKPATELDWVQIEITSSCNASCSYCPQAEYRENWQNRQISMEQFRSLLPALEITNHIHLQGWGEPFTHPDFVDILALCKRNSRFVSTTTNGTLLETRHIEGLVTGGLDVIAFSLAGVDERNDSVRRGNSIKKTLEAVEQLHKIKARYGADTPRIHIAYMLLRSGLNQIHRLPELFGNNGIDQAVISTLSFVVRRELEGESFAAMNGDEYAEVTQLLAEMREQSKAAGADVFFHVVSPQVNNALCSENIGRALFIGSDGGVSPCVLTNIPMNGNNFHYSDGIKTRHRNEVFGNAFDVPVVDIWNQKRYNRFRTSFTEGNKLDTCIDCLKLRIDNLLPNAQ